MEYKVTLIGFYILKVHSQHICFLRNDHLDNPSGEPKHAKLLGEDKGIMGQKVEKSQTMTTDQS